MLKAEVIEILLYGCGVCDVDPLREALRQAPQVLLRVKGFQSRQRSDHTHPLVREGAQEDTMREHRNDYPQTANVLFAGAVHAAKGGATTQWDVVRDDDQCGGPETGRTNDYSAYMPIFGQRPRGVSSRLGVHGSAPR